MADNGSSNWGSGSADNLNLPDNEATTSPTSAGDGNFTFLQWLQRVTGQSRALDAVLFGAGLTHDLSLNSHKATNAATPTAGGDVTNKTYVDAGLATKAPGLTPTAVKTANYTAAAGDFVPVDTTSGAVTVTLPTAPADGTRVGVKMVIQGSTNAVTIARGGSDVFNKTSGSTSLTLSLLNQAVSLQYKATGAIWYVIGDDLPLSDLDARYVASVAAGDSTITVGGTAGSPTVSVATGGVTTSQIANGTILDADVSGSAAIAYSKLNLAGSIVNADIGASAAISPSKIAGAPTTITSTNASWPIPSGATVLEVIAVGGGGGAGGGGSAAAAQLNVGGGGGGAGAHSQQYVSVGANTTLNVTIGAGGGGGTAGAAGGNAGGIGSNGSNTTVTGTGISITGAGGSQGRGGGASSTTVVAGGQMGQAAGTGSSVTSPSPGSGGGSGISGGAPIGWASGGGSGGVAASATLGGNGGNAGSRSAQAAQPSGNTGTSTGGDGASASANTGGGGAGGGGGAAGTGAGGAGGAGGSGYVTIRVIA